MGEKVDLHVGGYHCTEAIGTGGMGSVFKATVEADGKPVAKGATVAVKLLHPHLRSVPEFIKRFHREAKLAAKIDHPNVVRVIEDGQEGHHHYIVMEYAEGLRLNDLIGGQPLSPQQTIEVMNQTCAALTAAGSIADPEEPGRIRSLVHRDIKPDNLIIQPLDRKQLDTMTQTGDKTALANIRVKLLDFGLAKDVKALSTILSQTGQSLGTPAYMSPEQCRGGEVDPRSDIYSLGVVAYHMITGTQPFAGPTTVAFAQQHAEEIPPDILKRNPMCPRNLADCIYRCLAKDPKDRYADPAELQADLVRVAKGQPVAKVHRFKKKGSFSTKKVAVIAGAGVLACLLAVAAVSYFTTDRAKTDLAQAMQRADVQIAAQDYAGAKKTLEDAIAAVPDRGDKAELTEPAQKKLTEIVPKAVAQEEDRKVAALLKEASDLLAAGKFQEARDTAQSGFIGYPHNPRVEEFRRIRDEAERKISEAAVAKTQREQEAKIELTKAQTKFDAADYKSAVQIASDALGKYADTSAKSSLEALVQQANAKLSEQAGFEKNAQTALANIHSLIAERKWAQAVAASNEAVTTYASAVCATELRQARVQATDGKNESDKRFTQYRDEGDAAFNAIPANYAAARLSYKKALAEHEDTDVKDRLATCVDRTTKQPVAVIDFEEKGDVASALGAKDAGQTVAELVLTRFGQDRYQLIERSQLAALLANVDLTIALVRDDPEKVIGKLTGVKYLVLGRVSKLGNIIVTARTVNATDGKVLQTAEVSAEDARGIQNALTELVKILQMTDPEKKAYLDEKQYPQLLADARSKAQAEDFDGAIAIYRRALAIKSTVAVEDELKKVQSDKAVGDTPENLLRHLVDSFSSRDPVKFGQGFHPSLSGKVTEAFKVELDAMACMRQLLAEAKTHFSKEDYDGLYKQYGPFTENYIVCCGMFWPLSLELAAIDWKQMVIQTSGVKAQVTYKGKSLWDGPMGIRQVGNRWYVDCDDDKTRKEFLATMDRDAEGHKAALDGIRAQIQAIKDGKLQSLKEMQSFNPGTGKTIVPKELTLDLGNQVTMKLALIPAGKFTMGSPAGEKDRADDEVQHDVTISKPFYMGIFEVTQEQYQQVVGTNPSKFKGAQNPVEQVSWNDAADFCKKLSQTTGKTVTLPTEAQWEYACRAGTTTPFHTGQTISTDEANYNGNSVYGNGQKGTDRQTTIPVGSFKPNAFGLYDMHGNVLEWCSDWYGSYANANQVDPAGPSSGEYRVLRGGCWNGIPQDCRSAGRSGVVPGYPGYRFSNFGFRVVVDLK